MLFIYLGFYVAFNTVQVISRWVVGRAEETSTYSLLGFCIVNCRPTASNYQLCHLRPCWGSNPGLRGGRRGLYVVYFCFISFFVYVFFCFLLELCTQSNTELYRVYAMFFSLVCFIFQNKVIINVSKNGQQISTTALGWESQVQNLRNVCARH